MVIDVIPVPWNAQLPISVTDDGSVMPVSDEQPLKASDPILLTTNSLLS
jgi:hypothetical protein